MYINETFWSVPVSILSSWNADGHVVPIMSINYPTDPTMVCVRACACVCVRACACVPVCVMTK